MKGAEGMNGKICPLLSIAAGELTKSDCSNCEWGYELYNSKGDQETCVTWHCAVLRHDAWEEMDEDGP